MSKFLDKTKKFFDNLSSKPTIGGLQISDSALQIVFFDKDKKNPSTFSLRLPPGIIEAGKIKDEKKLFDYFTQLHRSLFPNNPETNAKVVVSLPSAITYTQIFNIPNVGEKNLKESADLNIQMISPIPADNAYMSWQLVDETDDKYEILGAFTEKDMVDKFIAIMSKAKFQAVAMEFPSLSLSWMITDAIGTKKEAFLVLSISGDGFDIFLVKNGFIYFDYLQSWKSVQGNESNISKETFHRVIIDEVRKVINFTSNRFGEELKLALIVAPGLGETIKELIEDSFSIKAANFVSNFSNLGSVWYVALGSAIRGSLDRGDDNFISLGTEKAQTIFYREQVIDFINLWRNIIVTTLVSFLVLFGGSILLIDAQPSLVGEGEDVLNTGGQEQELNTFIENIQEFNNLVSSISNAKSSDGASVFLNDFNALAVDNGILIDSVSMTSFSNPITVTAKSSSHDNVIRFRNVLLEDNSYSQINLPFSNIVNSEDNNVRFSVSFLFANNR